MKSLKELTDSLSSSLLIKGDEKTGYRDPAILFHDGVFYLYTTLVETEADGTVYMYTALFESTDLINWTKPKKLTPRDRSKNFSSPGNIVCFNGKWVMCFQTYCRENGEKYGNNNSRIFVTESDDLKNWNEPRALLVRGNDVPLEKCGRMIDPYLIEKDGVWYCFFKQNGQICYSTSDDLVNWNYEGVICGGENPSIIKHDGTYYLYGSPSNGIIVKTSKNLLDWDASETLLTFGQNDWEWAKGRITAGAVIPYGEGWLMFFHGTGPEDESVIFDTHACIGVAWSYDLKNWNWK